MFPPLYELSLLKLESVSVAASPERVRRPRDAYWSKFQVRDWLTSEKYKKFKNKVEAENKTFAEHLNEWDASQEVYDDVLIFSEKEQTQNIRYFLNKTDLWDELSVIYWALQLHQFCNPTSTFDCLAPTDTQKVGAVTNRRFAALADGPKGLFCDEMLQHVYERMFKYGSVLYSVDEGSTESPGVCLEFFSGRMACSSVSWWESKLLDSDELRALGFYRKPLSAGTFNQTDTFVKYATDESVRGWTNVKLLLPDVAAYEIDAGKECNFKSRMDAEGLVIRTSKSDPGDPDLSIDRALRELILGGFACSNGFGPRILAAWIVPEGCEPYTYSMKINSPYEELASGVKDVEKWYEEKLPITPWWSEPHKLGKADTAKEIKWGDSLLPVEWSDVRNVERKENNVKKGAYRWKRMVVVMERFRGAVSYINNDFSQNRQTKRKQKELLLIELMEQCDRISVAGMLHADIKDANMVYNVWNSNPEGSQYDWDRIECRFIDFDPTLCKLCPYVPWEVLSLIHVVTLFSFARCYSAILWEEWMADKVKKKVDLLTRQIKELYTKDVFVKAFLTLVPVRPRYEKIPDPMAQKTGMERSQASALQQESKRSAAFVLNDPYAAATAFRLFVSHYLKNECAPIKGGSYDDIKIRPNVPMLARVLEFALKGRIDVPQNYVDADNFPKVDENGLKRNRESDGNSVDSDAGEQLLARGVLALDNVVMTQRYPSLYL